jgi:molecular chaperone GrpE (heat shock protein)
MTLQDRINSFESEARGRIRRALATGNEKLMELDGALAKVARDDWTVPGMRRHLHELRARAENLRSSTLKKVEALPGEAVTKLASNTRAPVQNLAKAISELAKKMEPPKPKPVEAKPEPKVAKAS